MLSADYLPIIRLSPELADGVVMTVNIDEVPNALPI